MATRLKETDASSSTSARRVVLPRCLAQAGRSCRSGSRNVAHAPRLAPDELRSNYRGWPSVQRPARRFPRRAPVGAAGPRNIHPMQNRVGGTTLHYWAQSWRLNPWDFKVVSETTRRYGAGRIEIDRRDWPSATTSRAVLRQDRCEVGISGRPATSTGRLIHAATASRATQAACRCRRCVGPPSSRR